MLKKLVLTMSLSISLLGLYGYITGEPQVDHMVTYTVQPNDTWGSILNAHNGGYKSVDPEYAIQLAMMNGRFEGQSAKPGDVISVPVFKH